MRNYVLCDDPVIREQLLPFTFTRPIANLRMGIFTFEEKWSRLLDGISGFYTVDYLSNKYPFHPKDPSEGGIWMLNASILPTAQLVEKIKQLSKDEALVYGDTWVAFFVPETQWNEKGKIYPQAFDCLSGRGNVSYDGELMKICHPWDIFSLNDKQIKADLELLMKEKPSYTIDGEGMSTWGAYPLYAEPGARVDHALIDTSEGPVYLGRNSRIMPGSLVKGPLALCEGSIIKMGAKIYGGNTFGPYCKVAGEVESTVMLGYSNKAHDGFIGDAVIGEWCNLGAGTNCSNLKNDYSQVRVWSYPKESFIKTGLQFCGLFLADHSKSAIGTQFNTGTVVGVAANVFASGFPRNFIPSFTWGKEPYKIDRALETARIVYARRGKTFDAEDEAILRAVYSLTEVNREKHSL